MKIAVFYELDPGGARRGANEFARAMKKKGHSIDLFCIDHLYPTQETSFYANIHFYPFIPVTWIGHDWKARLYRDTFELYRLFQLHQRIAKDMTIGQYDAALVHPSKFTQAPYILRFLKIPSVYYCQESLRMVYESIFPIPKNISLFKQWYERGIRLVRKSIDAHNIRSADYIFANSRFTQANIWNAYKLRSTVCHMGVDTLTFYPSKKTKVKNKKPIDILFIGTRDITEGYGLFQESLKCMKYKAHVHYLLRGENWTTKDVQLRDYYSTSRIVICFGYNEPFGLIPLEAMACGAVIVALKEGGYIDSIKHGKTGVLVKKHPKEIGKVLDTLLSSPLIINQMSKSAQEDMNTHWQWNKGAEKIVKTIVALRKHKS